MMVLAYGSWGLVAGQSGTASNKGSPPCIGVGMMRKLSKRFLVSPTPEQFTSKTCCRCLHPCAPWAEVEDKMKPILEKRMKRYKGIRGLRICQDEDCNLPQNWDRPRERLGCGSHACRAWAHTKHDGEGTSLAFLIIV